MRFWKYQGCGNDFVLVDGISEKLEIDVPWCVKVCDRHFGVGADGVLYLLPGENGCDITFVAEPVASGTMISPQMYDEWALPYLKKLLSVVLPERCRARHGLLKLMKVSFPEMTFQML